MTENLSEIRLIVILVKPLVLTDAAVQRDFIEKNVMCSFENIETSNHFYDRLLKGDLSFYEDSKNQRILDSLQDSILSSIYYGEEISEKKVLDLVKDFSVEETVDLKYEFTRFFCMQYFRTPRVHEDIKRNIEGLKEKYEEIKDMNINFFTNMILVYFAERMALNLTQNFNYIKTIQTFHLLQETLLSFVLQEGRWIL